MLTAAMGTVLTFRRSVLMMRADDDKVRGWQILLFTLIRIRLIMVSIVVLAHNIDACS